MYLVDLDDVSCEDVTSYRVRSFISHRCRIACVRAAAHSIRSGSYADARRYAQRGAEYTSEWQSSQLNALVATFRRNNLKFDPTRMIDLHGLYVREAVRLVRFFVRRAAASGRAELIVIVGKGLHSPQPVRAGGRSPLKHAIEKWAKTYHIKATEPQEGQIKLYWANTPHIEIELERERDTRRER